MKRLVYLSFTAFTVLILLPMGSVWAQTSAKKSSPQVPITYQGDTDEAMRRRAQWVEGAKKEGALEW